MTSKPLKWHGGKHYLADWILSHAPEEYTTYLEPFFGGGSVLFRHPPGKSEIVNDVHGPLSIFWSVLQDESLLRALKRKLDATPLSETVFEIACDHLEGFKHYDGELDTQMLLNTAWAFFVKYRQSRQGIGKVFATLSTGRTRRGMNEQASSWLSAIEGLPEAHQRLRGVVILNRDAIEVMLAHNKPSVWAYLDPPYLPETRTAPTIYEHEYSEESHIELLTMLGCDFRGKFALSGYPSAVYNDAADTFGWRCVSKEIVNSASSRKSKTLKTECLWMNY